MFFRDDSPVCNHGGVICDEEGWKVESSARDLNLDAKVIPEVYNFQDKTPEQIHAEFLADQIKLQSQIDAGAAIKHPEFPDNWEMDMEGLAKMWDDVARAMPEYKEVAEEWEKEVPVWHRRVKDASDYTAPSKRRMEILKLAGVVPEDAEEGEECRPDYRRALMKAIANEEFPENMVLDIIDEKLCVNGVPTKISGDGIEYLFLGLLELEGKQRALDFTAKIVRKKLKKLF